MPIRQLAPDVAAKIAAGEVVERPASVVKELIENSIDAGATQLRVDLSHGGLQLIRVTDNGSGIAADELALALSRHATSKVANIDDLEHIHTLGFRGEALASIAAVADVTLISRLRGNPQGAQISANNGQLSEVTSAASQEGTTITVRNLFSAVPARLKFLKGRNTEVSHCHHLLEQYALAYPEIRFSVFSENKQIFSTPGNGQLFSVLVEIYGLQVAEQMVPFQRSEHPDNPEYPVVSGYTSRPTCYKSTRQYISFFVNRRWVLSRMLTAAVEGAYHSLLLIGRHPIAVVNIEIDPSLLDVNVHPAKTEIRFLKERRVFAVILRAIRAALLDEQESSSAHESETEELDINELSSSSDELADEQHSSGDTSQSEFPQVNPWLTVTEEETGTKPPPSSRLWQSHIPHKMDTALPPVGAGDVGTRGEDPWVARANDNTHMPLELLLPPTQHGEDAQNNDPLPTVRATQGSSPNTAASPALTGMAQPASINIEVAQEALDIEAHLAPMKMNGMGRRLPRLRVVGQLSQSYIVTEGEDGMYLIDQHAAHERILLERMVASLQARTPMSQHLLTPLELELSPQELEAIEDHQQQLTHIGFAFETDNSGTLAVTAVPNVLVKQMNVRSLHELLLEITTPENLGHTETWEERALANVACKAAIKANYFLTVSEMREMLEQLEQTKAPFSCCHGRPTMIHFALPALAREFERR